MGNLRAALFYIDELTCAATDTGCHIRYRNLYAPSTVRISSLRLDSFEQRRAFTLISRTLAKPNALLVL